MPDQSSASSEHALMQEITAPLATLPDDPVPVVADVDFPIVLRGYDRDSVDAYVRRISQFVAELQTTRSPEAAVRRALERVGEEVSGILQRAHDTAGRITAQSRSEAEDRLEAARQEAAQIVSRAEERVRELDAETDRIWGERHRIVEDTRDLARELLTLTDSAADRFPPDAAVGADSALPGLEAVPPAGIEAVPPAGIEALPPAGIEAVPPAGIDAVAPEPVGVAPDFEGEAPEFEGEAPEFEDEAPEFEGEAPEFEVGARDPEPDAEATAILPVVEPAEPVTEEGEGAEASEEDGAPQ
ncbi:MAG TPA: DivIVA domain-containing protein [Solirubrobacteraceae bacterium]|nr:DivIVA domain-containing protein [Solirubrobacteraceae bacterium]